MNTKFAFYDFDNTIVRGDSIGHLLKFVMKQNPLRVIHFLKIGWRFLCYKFKTCSFEHVKEAMLFSIDALTQEQLKQFATEILPKHFYPNVVETIHQHKQDGYTLVLVSASVEQYLVYLDLPFDFIIGTRYKDGKILGKNCVYKNKVDRIEEYLQQQNKTIHKEQSIGYSDSALDIPMLELVKTWVQVERKTGIMKEWSLQPKNK